MSTPTKRPVIIGVRDDGWVILRFPEDNGVFEFPPNDAMLISAGIASAALAGGASIDLFEDKMDEICARETILPKMELSA